ncbi:MAG: hypothetical protein HC896_07680 [Bacteroidales bacterium]|nr:hypothetical protein [Bacteroidales bacterium]
MMAGPITKWQEDGLFYVVWPAFTHWTQTGDKSLCEGKYLNNMEKAMVWLEKRAFDKEKGLFGRYFACETPMTGSYDDGWDNATGAPTFKWGSDYEGNTITRTYDIYINLLNYSNYVMLSAMQTDKTKAERYYEKATNLEKNIHKFFDYDNILPSYGDLLTNKGGLVTAKPYGMDIWDYVWGLSLPPFEANIPAKYRDLREQIRKDMTTTNSGYFLCVYFALLTSMDTEIHSEDSIMAAMDKLVPVSAKPGKYLPMPYAMPEMFNVSEDNPYHDIRPLVYSIAPWLSAVTNLGIHRMPFGIAARGTNYLEKIENYQYKGANINAVYEGKGVLNTVSLNGKVLAHSLQIPENMLKKGDNALIVQLGKDKGPKNLLIASTVQLNAIATANGKVVYKITSYGKNVLTFKGLNKSVAVADANGNKVKATAIEMDNLTYIEFEGRGEFNVEL